MPKNDYVICERSLVITYQPQETDTFQQKTFSARADFWRTPHKL